MSRLGTLWRTVRHLRPVQVIGRARLYLWHRPQVDKRPAPPLRAATGHWVACAGREASLVGPERFRFLSVEHALAEVGWDDPKVARLWRYNLHYFDDLNAQGAAQRSASHRALLDRWLADNPPPTGTAWEPYPVSLRIVNWIKWFLAGAHPEPAWLHSLAVQARWLGQHLEWHLLGNHLFANAKALVFAGLYFDGDEARHWLQTGLRILQREIPEQILADGGHFERSPMYHALALEDLLDLLNLLQARAPAGSPAANLQATLREHAARMLQWLHCMSHPDGTVGLFNDAAHGIAPDNTALDAYAARLGVVAGTIEDGVRPLQPSGYVRVTRGAVRALLDCAPIGPDYLVGHAHADTLAFELSLHGRRLIVNGGTSCYGLDAQRLHERGTAWHSTVQVAGANSSEVWSGFRVGRRARVIRSQVQGWSVLAAHDGYHHLAG
ncbi:MAG: heparinase, partial [Burkholderiales bacterium PBB5]